MMKYDPKIHHRKSIRLKNYDYSQTGLYFITICTQNRLHLFGEIVDDAMVLNDAGAMIENEWIKLSQRFNDIEIQQYVVMPNHIHGIINRRGEPCVRPNIRPNACANKPITDETNQMQGEQGEHKVRPYGTLDGTVGRVIQAYKSIATVEYTRGVKNNDWQRFNKKLWQRNYWEHIIRNENEYNRIAQYIMNNPKKWALDKLNGGMGNAVMEQSPFYNQEAWMI